MLFCQRAAMADEAPRTADKTLAVESFALNKYARVLDGQWQGIGVASDGNCYFGSSTHAHNHGAAFFRYDPRAKELKLLCEDITKICGEDPTKTPPQGKLHSDIVEANGWLYFATHLANYWPEAEAAYTGAHVIGYELASGKFRDLGIVRRNYSIYSGVQVDAKRKKLYVFVTSFNEPEAKKDGSHLYRIDLESGRKEELGMVKAGGPHGSFHLFVDGRGDCWFTIGRDNGTLCCARLATGKIDRWENVLPDPSAGADRAWHWAQPLPDGKRCAFTLMDGNKLWIFDADQFSRDPSKGFQVVQDIGYSYLGMALAKNRVYYIQRAGRKKGHQNASDHHLLSVALDPKTAPAIIDYGLIVDRAGRQPWRIPGLTADGQGNVFMVGDWNLLAGETGTLRHDKGDQYKELRRGEFFAVAKAVE
jgi:hypothetical protein